MNPDETPTGGDDAWGDGPIGDEPIGDQPLVTDAAIASLLGGAPAMATSAPTPQPALAGVGAAALSSGVASSVPAPAVSAATFAPLTTADGAAEETNIDLLMDVSLQISVELGRTRMKIGEILALRAGSVIELDKLAGEPADILVNGTLIARGEVVVVDEKFGVRVMEVVSRTKRLLSLG